MVDFVADYYKNIEDFPVLSQVEPGYLHNHLPAFAPTMSDSLESVLDDVKEKILAGVTHWQSPNYFAYFPANSSIAGFLGEMLSAAVNIVGFNWITSPAATELEMIVLDWLAKLLDLPDDFLSSGKGGGVIQGSTTEAILVVLLAARDRALRRYGKTSLKKLVVYASDQTHCALQKACQIVGIDPKNCRLLKADLSTNYALSPDVLSEAISHDITVGLIPLFLCATVGTTSSTAIDPLLALGGIVKRYKMWFHVDAAYAGSACICPEYRQYIDGVEETDSFNMSAHKWFLTNLDCTALWVKDRNALIQSLSTNPEYMKNKASEAKMVVDYKDWQIPFGRRFRSLKLWMVLRLYGVEKIQNYIRYSVKLAEHFEGLVARDPRFEIVTPRVFSLVCFRLLPPCKTEDGGNELNQNLLDATNASGKIFMSHTVLSGKYILRFAAGAPLTEAKHVNAAWKARKHTDDDNTIVPYQLVLSTSSQILIRKKILDGILSSPPISHTESPARKLSVKSIFRFLHRITFHFPESSPKNSDGKMDNDLKPMDAEQLREYAHKMVDFVADYYKSIEEFPVLSQVEPGYLQNLLPEAAPTNPESLQSILDDVQKKILPGVTHWQSPSYFAYYPSNSSIAGYLGEMLSAAVNIVGFSWITSPAATELEMIVLDWLAKLLKLPDGFLSSGKGGGVIQGTASEAILVVLLAARDQALRKVGKNSLEKLVVYASDQTHAALQKACQIGGIHPENCRLLKADLSTNYALSPDVLSIAISHDVAIGLIPLFLCATVGTTSSTAIDPLPALGKIAKRYEMWFHVDAAYAGSACICPEFRQYIDGVEEADSFNMNAHKWFLTNFDCSTLWVKDRNALVQSLSTNPEYLKNKASQAQMVVDYKDWQIPLGRRFRSLKLWMVLRLYGIDNLQKYIRYHVKLAEHFEGLVSEDPRFEIVTPRVFSLVCFRLLPPSKNEDGGNKLNQSLLDAVNSTGKIFISHAVLSGKYILRFAVGAPLTEEKHVTAAWKVMQDEASALLAN